jgi:hypothetical protein
VNVIYRIGDHLYARLPRVQQWAQDLDKEWHWLPKLAPRVSLRVPEPVGKGHPASSYPFSWAIYGWIDGQPYADELVVSRCPRRRRRHVEPSTRLRTPPSGHTRIGLPKVAGAVSSDRRISAADGGAYVPNEANLWPSLSRLVFEVFRTGVHLRHYDTYLRWLYRGGRPNRFARVQNRVSAIAFAAGVWPKRAATLEVRGRRSGRVISFPLVIADHEGERYLVAMLGENTSWVRNVRAAGGRAVLCHGRREDLRLEEVAIHNRPVILRRYLALAPGARPHIRIDRHSSLEEFDRIAPHIPVFRITSASTPDEA